MTKRAAFSDSLFGDMRLERLNTADYANRRASYAATLAKSALLRQSQQPLLYR